MIPSAPPPRLAPWLEQCIQSIRQQSLTDLEIIVVDDGSTDATGELLEAWVAEESRLKVLHQPNAGQSAARNRALELVRSPYFTFVDGDDYLSPDVLEEAVALLESEPELGLVEFGFVEEYSDGRCQPQLHSSLRYTSLEAARSLALSAEVSGMPWGKVYRSSVASDLRFPEGRIFEDTPFVLEVLMRTTAYAYLPSCGYHYRVMRSGSSTERWDGRLCHLFENGSSSVIRPTARWSMSSCSDGSSSLSSGPTAIAPSSLACWLCCCPIHAPCEESPLPQEAGAYG